MIIPLFFLLYCIVMTPFEFNFYRLLKEIDFSSMTVKEVSKRILKYQNIIRKFEMYGIVGAVVYMGIWCYFFYFLSFGSKILWGFIIFMIVVCIIAALSIPFLYKKLYYNNINSIKESLKELREFEEM